MKARLQLAVFFGVLTCLGCGQDAATTTSESPNASTLANDAAGDMTKESSEGPSPKANVPIRKVDLPEPVTLTTEDWPQFRGQRRDGVSQSTGLVRTWPTSGPKTVWQATVGQGYAAPSVVGERVYLNDYDEEENEWMVRCFALDDGEELWQYKVKKRIRPNHAITRSAPATDGGFVFAIDPKCELHCLDARNGELIWKKFLPAEYESQIPAWYNGQCPLIDGDKLVIATGGRVLMTALEKATGEAIWETDNSDEFLMSHSSIMPVEIDGLRQYAYTTLKGLVGVDAQSGELLWHFPWRFNTAISTTPLPLGGGKFFLTGGYHARTVVCQVTRGGDGWTTEEMVSLPPPTGGWNSEVQTPILHAGHIYGIGKKQRGLWTCLDYEGNEIWTSKGKASFGMGGYVLADGMFFVLEGKTGMLRVLDANAEHYEELASVKMLDGPDVWAPPVVAHGKLLIRDLGKLICLDIAAENPRVANVMANER